MDNTLTFDHVSFNVSYYASKSVADFIEDQKHVGLTDAQLREAHSLIVEAAKPKAPVKEIVVEEPKEKTEAGSIPVKGDAAFVPLPIGQSFIVGDTEVHLD